MNKVPDLPPAQLSHADRPDEAPFSYRPLGASVADMVRTPAKVTGAVLGAAALGYLALMKKRRVRPARVLTPQEAAHRLAAKPAPGMPLAGAMPDNRPAKQRRSAKRQTAAAKAGSQPGAFRQIVNTGRSLM